jgi:hydrogenase maturation protein HypF
MERAFARALAPVAPAELDVARSQIERSLNAPLASSMGRLFDAAAAVLGIRHVAQYEAQAAMELEAVAGARPATPLPFPILPDGDGWLLDPIPLLVALGELAALGEDRADLAARFHESVAHSTAVLVGRVAEASNVRTVVLGGGVFQNARLASSVTRELATLNLDAKLPRLLSPNDGAISYGQAAVAAAQLQSER